MFNKNNTTMNNKKQYEKVNHYDIKKFNVGTASVLIASAFMFLGGAAQAADTNKQQTTVAVAEKVATTTTEEKEEVAKAEIPEKPGQNNTPVQPKANAQVKRLANTGTTETNTGLAGLGLATFAGILVASKRRKEK